MTTKPPFFRNANPIAYAASKWALRGLAEALQQELKPHNIFVSVAYPPDTDTPGKLLMAMMIVYKCCIAFDELNRAWGVSLCMC